MPGEGAGILILEEREHAWNAGRGSTVRSWAAAPAATPCPPAGSTRKAAAPRSPSRRRSRKPAFSPAEVGHVNAHGSATKVSDLAEARALRRIFGPRGVPVTALKGYMGNLVSGCGAVELICSLIGVNRGRIPPILNCDQPDPECELDLVLKSPRPSSQPDVRQHEPDSARPGGGAAWSGAARQNRPPRPVSAVTRAASDDVADRLLGQGNTIRRGVAVDAASRRDRNGNGHPAGA